MTGSLFESEDDGSKRGPIVPRAISLARELRELGIRDRWVLEAIASVPRHRFVPFPMAEHAYENRALAIGHGQTISQPWVVARMTELLELAGDERAAEVGTGSGYQAAILSRLARTVDTVERIPELHERASATLARLGYTNVRCRLDDGSAGLAFDAREEEEQGGPPEPGEEPYDAILVTAAAPRPPTALLARLAPRGRLVVPIGDREIQVLRRYRRRDDGTFEEEDFEKVVFVPLVGAEAWPDSGDL